MSEWKPADQDHSQEPLVKRDWSKPKSCASVCRMVHFVPPQECQAPSTLQFYAAIITQVNADETCELATFGPNSLYFQHNVPFSDILCPGHWSWPAKV